MEQENQRLKHRVERAGLRADRAAADSHESVAELQQQLDKKKRTITELHERLVSLKLEAEQAQALRGQIERLERTSRDMAMCVETLEEENEFLQEQIRALLQLDQDQTVYEADGSKSGAPAQDELHKLQEEIRTRDEKLKALEEKYAAMEQEYLTLYEEANA
jgi:chromosome segregation ATPase